VDVSASLVLPFSALMAFVTVSGAAAIYRERPRLIWPFAFSSVLATAALFAYRTEQEVGQWLWAIILVVLWPAAIGTVIGAVLAGAVLGVIRWIRSR
jgi:hypothetical protein